MKYCSIDIETTGLDYNSCQMIEFGAVADDLSNPQPLNKLPLFHCYILRDKYIGEPYAFSMNAKIMERIAKQEKGFLYLRSDQAAAKFAAFLQLNFGEAKVNVAGKNFASFDLHFLNNEGWMSPGIGINFSHRVIDPAMLYFDPWFDKSIPNTNLCLERAKINKKSSHTAIEDALDVIRLLRYHYKIEP